MKISLLIIVIVAAAFPLFSCSKTPELVWKYKTGGYIYSSPILAGDHVVIGSTDGNLYALNARSGSLVWKSRLGNRIYSTPLLHKDTIYIGSDTGDFYAIDPENGNTRWRYHTKEMIHYTACGDDSGVYFGSRDAGFYKLAFDGTKIWEFRGGFRMGGNCSFYKNLVLTASWDTHLYALDKETGSLQWKYSTGKINYGGAAIVGDDAYLSSHNYLYRFQAADGKLIAKAQFGQVNEVLAWRDHIWTSDNGLRRWSKDLTEQKFVAAPSQSGFAPVAANDYVILSGENVLSAVSPEEMKVVWKYKTDDDFWAPGVVQDKYYYTGNRDTYVYALRLP